MADSFPSSGTDLCARDFAGGSIRVLTTPLAGRVCVDRDLLHRLGSDSHLAPLKDIELPCIVRVDSVPSNSRPLHIDGVCLEVVPQALLQRAVATVRRVP